MNDHDEKTDKQRADYYEMEYRRQKQIRSVMIGEFMDILGWETFTWQMLADLLKAAAAENMPSPLLKNALDQGK